MKNQWINIPILLLLSIIWGFSFILMKRGMFDEMGNTIFTSTQVGALRILFASLIILPLSVKLFRNIKDLKTWGILLLSGLCGNFIPAFLFTFAEQSVDSGYAGMLNSFTPMFTLGIGFIAFGRKVQKTEFLGVLIGAIGAIILGTASTSTSLEQTSIHTLAIILATALYGLNINLIKKHLSHLPAQQISASVFLTLLIPSIIATISTGTFDTLLQHPKAWDAIRYIAILGIVGTACTTLLYNRVIATTSPVYASTVTLLIPIVAMTIGHFTGEHITTQQVIGMVITLVGIIFITVISSLSNKAK